MKPKAIEDEAIVIRYLLGDLPEDQQRQLAERCYTDSAWFEQVLTVKDDLFADYARGALSPSDRQRFERRFLSTPEGRQQIEFTRTMLQVVDEEPEPRWWPSFLAFWRSRGPVIELTMATAALLVGVIGTWGVLEYKSKNLQAQLAQLQAQQQALRHREQELQQLMAEQRQHQDDLTAQLQRERAERERLEQEVAQLQSRWSNMVSFIFPSGSLRGSTEQKQIVIPSGIQTVNLQLDGEEEYQRYRAVIRAAGGDEVWSRTDLPAQPTRWGPVVILPVSARVLGAGNYELELSGMTAQGQFEPVDYYRFSVLRGR
jgi:anti-sigma-K factor RskA